MLLEEGELITKGQALFFILAMAIFGVVIIILYGQDRKRNPNYFKGTWKIFAGLILIVSILFLIVMSRK